MTISLVTFSMTGDTYDERITLPLPETFNWADNYEVPVFNLWSEDIVVRNMGKTDEPLTLNGSYQGFSSPTYKIFERYTGTAAWASIYLNQYQGQIITVGDSGENCYQRISQVSIIAKRSSVYSVSAATVIFCYLKNTLTGAVLSSGTMTANGISTTGATYGITMSPEVLLCPNSEYAIIIGSTATNSARVYMALKATGAYTGGKNYYSTDGGLTWIEYTGYDAQFYFYGYRDETPYSIFGKLDSMLGQEFTLTGFHNTDIDNTWVISNYTYSTIEGKPYYVDWSITLEKT